MDPFFAHALEVAPSLLGARLTANGVTVRLTEVEAYGGEGADPGSHAFRGPGKRNATMFGPPGRLYVYFTYGMHWCVNVVCSPDGEASAVLLRAGEIVDGLDLARSRRMHAGSDTRLASGPARLAVALALTGADDGTVLAIGVDAEASNPGPDAPGRPDGLALRLPAATPSAVRSGPRTGVSGPGGDADAFPWRFWLPDEPTVSPYRPHQPKRRSTVPPPVR